MATDLYQRVVSGTVLQSEAFKLPMEMYPFVMDSWEVLKDLLFSELDWPCCRYRITLARGEIRFLRHGSLMSCSPTSRGSFGGQERRQSGAKK